MKKLILLISLISVASVVFMHSDQSQAANFSAFLTNTGLKSDNSRAALPRQLPTTIKDPILLAAWDYLYNQTQPIQLLGGRSLSGRQLAQSVVDDRMVIVWDTENLCKGDTCSFRPVCTSAQCKQEDYPIYIAMYFKDDKKQDTTSLAIILAHEIFHHTRPFGFGADTLFEEYWAYTIQAAISNTLWDATPIDPLNPVCLHQWFIKHHLVHYQNHAVYPPSVSSLVENSAQTCLLD